MNYLGLLGFTVTIPSEPLPVLFAIQANVLNDILTLT
jgi:hypothetical protein